MDANQLERAIVSDPTTSAWLKSQIEQLKGRDPLDAVNDVETLLALLQLRLKECMLQHEKVVFIDPSKEKGTAFNPSDIHSQ